MLAMRDDHEPVCDGLERGGKLLVEVHNADGVPAEHKGAAALAQEPAKPAAACGALCAQPAITPARARLRASPSGNWFAQARAAFESVVAHWLARESMTLFWRSPAGWLWV